MTVLNDEVLDSGSSALVLIDLQSDLLLDDEGQELNWARPVIAATNRAIKWARNELIPIIWVRVERRPDYMDVRPSARGSSRRLIEKSKGSGAPDTLNESDSDFVVLKSRVSAFYCTRLEIYLRSLGVRTVIVGGVYTHMGVESTVRDARDRDLDVIVLREACGAPSLAHHNNSLEYALPLLSKIWSVDQLRLV